MHIGKKNNKFQYSIGLETERQILDECEEEQGLIPTPSSPTASYQRRKNGRFALLSLVLGINGLGNWLGGSESA